jgi:hypothetical protein
MDYVLEACFANYSTCALDDRERGSWKAIHKNSLLLHGTELNDECVCFADVSWVSFWDCCNVFTR